MKKKRTLCVDNVTRHASVIEQGRVADTFWTRLKGLIGVRQWAPGDGLLLTATNSIHTHFMAMPIDVFYVNTDHEVIDVDVAMPPWRIGQPRRGARFVIEAPVGTVTRTGSMVGDKLKIQSAMTEQRSTD